MAKLMCDIVTPQAQVFSDEAYFVVVPGTDGEMGFYHGHVPLVSTLADGTVRVQSNEGADFQKFEIHGGYVQVSGDKVIILADEVAEA